MNTPSDTVSNSRALAAFSMGALFFALAFVQRVAPSVMTTELMRDFAVGGAALGTLSGWYFYAYASIQIPVGMLNDRFGPRKLMSVAVAVCALGSFGFALSETVLAASFFRAVVGASVAFAFRRHADHRRLLVRAGALCDAGGNGADRRHVRRHARTGAAALRR